MDKLPDNWLDLAASHGATKWVQHFIRTYLPQLKDQVISALAFAQTLEEELQARQLTTSAQQKNYRSNVVQAIKTLDSNHPAIALVSPTTEQYRKLNEEQRGRLAVRETKYFTSATAETLVERATSLLNSAEWSDVAAGLSVLIGRRISEILLSDFSLSTAWSLNFSEMSKKANAPGLIIEIPTLAPARRVLKAIERLQKSLSIEDLKLVSLTPKIAKQTVNNRYSGFVATKCHQHFHDLIPARADGENLYSHIFRAVYATIAAHWFCPPNVPEHNFKAEIQGHFTLTSDGHKLPNYSARANYDDYAIGTSDGNRDGRLGIKLGKLPDLEIIQAFTKETPAKSTAIFDKDKDKEAAQDAEPFIDKDTDTDTDTDKEINQESFRCRSTTTEEILIEENSPLRPRETTMAKPTAKPKTKRPEIHAADLEEMVSLMARRGVTGSTGELFHALIEAFKSGDEEQQQHQQRTVSELTNCLSWFTDRIDALERTLHQLQSQRDQLKGAQTTTDELNRLRDENARLKQKLQETESQLQGIKKFLGVGANGATATQPSLALPQPTTEKTPLQPIALQYGATEALSSSTITTTTTQPLTEAPTRRKRGDTDEKLNQIIDALLAWNTSQQSSDTQLRISIPTIKALASAMGANYQKAIQDILKERSSELDEHHSRLLIGTRHNALVLKKDEVLQAIARDYLGLDNWQEVKYAG